MDFVENASFKVLATFADHHGLQASLLDELSIDERDSDQWWRKMAVTGGAQWVYHMFTTIGIY